MNMRVDPMPTTPALPRRPAGPTPWRRFYYGIFGGDALGLAGTAMLAALLAIAIVGPWLVTHDPLLTTPQTLLPPTAEHWLGTDHFGRDVFSRTITSLRIDFIVAGLGVSGAILIGSLLGLVCGYVGGWFDDLVMRGVDIVQSFPLLLIAMVLILVMGPGLESIVIVTVLINIPIYARVIRGETLSRKTLEYIDAARCSGASEMSILFRHLMPNTLSPIIVHGSLNLAAAVGNVAALSFLGVGIRPPTPDLGVMVAEGTNYLVQGAWWMSIGPGLVLALTIFSLNLLGDCLEGRLDPRRTEA
ncbi:peptide ABC transporter permease [Devosia geojensis]|uniref:Peptide ABC transporter permease n=1 Tax=Devosia geojensis TaxID=443610 RepID=A0A0F5FSF1_9HYPH|nr:ABC transporter permease [Devosia geojensis]KKB11758.1 peptide ABC transporter permease [Devosia geojensis]